MGTQNKLRCQKGGYPEQTLKQKLVTCKKLYWQQLGGHLGHQVPPYSKHSIGKMLVEWKFWMNSVGETIWAKLLLVERCWWNSDVSRIQRSTKTISPRQFHQHPLTPYDEHWNVSRQSVLVLRFVLVNHSLVPRFVQGSGYPFFGVNY